MLPEYGTGAIMAVPAHDQRDFDFARDFDLPLRCVVVPDDGRGQRRLDLVEAYTAKSGVMVNARTASGTSPGWRSRTPPAAIVAWLEERSAARAGGVLPAA